MRRSLTLLVTVVVLIGLMAAPAAADEPTVFGPFTDVFPDTDPCTGFEMLVTINVTLYDHIGHNNNFVGRADKTGTTSSGYVMVGGHDNFQANNNVVIGSFKDVWRDPDDGTKIQATGKFRIAGNSMFIDEFNLRCVGAPTI